MKKFLFIVEGSQDIALLKRVLNVYFNINEITKEKNINEVFKDLIPKKFPFKDGSLTTFNFIPRFFGTENIQICILNANGEKELIKKLDNSINNLKLSELFEIDKICLFADGDLKDKGNKLKEIKDSVNDGDYKSISKDNFVGDKILINIADEAIEILTYIFPNNKDSGRIEQTIIQGIESNYSDIYNEAKKYITNVDEKHKKDSGWDSDNNSKEDKALIGCIGNIFYPGSSNTTIIEKDKFEWINENSSDTHILALRNFLGDIMGIENIE